MLSKALVGILFIFTTQFACSDDKTTSTKDVSTDAVDRLDQGHDVDVVNKVDGGEDVGSDLPVLTAETSFLKGRAVKGPFVKDTVIRIFQLGGDGERTGLLKLGYTDASGGFIVSPIGFSGWAAIEIDGNFFNELTGATDDYIVLAALVEVKDGKLNGSTNVFTNFTYKRALYLLKNNEITGIENAWKQALGEFWKIFQIGHQPKELNILNVDSYGKSLDNKSLLWFSATMLKAGFTNAKYKTMTSDFADDGKINGDGLAYFEAIQLAADDQVYITARTNLFARYGSAPPEFIFYSVHWKYRGCTPGITPDFEQICLGLNKTLETSLEKNTWVDFSFVAPTEGVFLFSANFPTFNRFHRWQLRDKDDVFVASGDSNNNWAAATTPLKTGQEYIFSAFAGDDIAKDLQVDVTQISHGTTNFPTPVMREITTLETIGFHDTAGVTSWKNYYLFYADQGEGPVRFLLTDFTGEKEILIYSGGPDERPIDVIGDADHLLKQAKGEGTVSIETVIDKAVIYVEIRNNSVRNDNPVPGIDTYELSVY